MPVVQLTPQFLKTLAPLPGKARTEWCDKNQPGLYVEARATSQGGGTYYIRYKDAGGKTRHKRIGPTDVMTLPEARAKAKEMRAEIQLGADPAAATRKQKQVPTFREFAEEQYLSYIRAKKRSYRDDKNRLYQHLIPKFGDQPLNTITRKQLVDFHLELKASGLAGATCDHFIKLVRAMYNVAIQWEVVAENPAAKISLFNIDNKVENIMDETQLQRLLLVLQTHPNRAACRIALFLLSTGCRLNEALCAEWNQIDWAQKVWRVPALNSKSKRMRPVPLNESALEVLGQVRNDHPQWVFFNSDTGTHFKGIHKAWAQLKTQAGMPWLRCHDLRHNFVSILASRGISLIYIQKLLGHSDPKVSMRYVHMDSRTLLEASEIASERIRMASPKLLPSPESQAQ